jgi:two-component system nitrogen regulation response regulator GlnG
MREAVWIVDDDRSIRWVLERALESKDIPSRSFESADNAMAALRSDTPAVVLTDVRMPGMDGFEFLDKLAEVDTCPVIVMTAHSDLDSAVASYQGGAFDYLPKPFDVNDAIAVVQRAQAYAAQTDAATAAPTGVDGGTQEIESTAGIIGQAPAMQQVYRAIGRLSGSSITVLINGASGTGKELVARALHTHSPRSLQPFVALNKAAIPSELIESELFGHEKGAFTGATARRVGRFEQAGGGTLFLDEIGDMPAALQTRLLRVLEDRTFFRVGGHTPVQVDVRVIAATHQDLEARVAQGQFREDLFHRLNVIRLHLPPLRNRREDINLLMDHFLNKVADELGIEAKTLHPDAATFLQSYEWSGNVRQLENVCRWLTVMAPAQEIHIEELPPEITNSDPSAQASGDWKSQLKYWADQRLASGDVDLLEEATQIFEKIMIEAALKKTGGRRQDAAKLLVCGRNTLTSKIKELEIEN